jgi:hypothetical protein
MWKFIGTAALVIALAVALFTARGPVIAAFLMLAFILAEPDNRKVRPPLLLRPFMKRQTQFIESADSTNDAKGEKHAETHAT